MGLTKLQVRNNILFKDIWSLNSIALNEPNFKIYYSKLGCR